MKRVIAIAESQPEFSDHIEELDHDLNDRLGMGYNNFTAPFNCVQLDP